MRHIFQKAYQALSDTVSSIIAFLSVLFFSSNRSARKFLKMRVSNKDGIVLGNGPSLKDTITHIRGISEGKDFFCVNTFYRMDEFWEFKPKYYIWIDPLLFDTTEKAKIIQEEALGVFQKVDWDMSLIIPYFHRNSSITKEIAKTKVKIVYVNTTPVNKGGKRLRHLLYDKQLAMPKTQTVLNSALYLTVLLRYNKVYLFGADHSWLKDLYVDDENYVCFGQRHAYDKDGKTTVTRKKLHTMASLLRDFSNMFESHMLIQEYATAKGVSIVNCTKGSFIDAYPREINN